MLYKYVAQVGSNYEWADYKCKITKAFLNSDTRKWVEQTYTYSVKLVSGVRTDEYLKSACRDNDISPDGKTVDELYQLLLDKGYTFPESFNKEHFVAIFDIAVPIITPSKLSVLSSIDDTF